MIVIKSKRFHLSFSDLNRKKKAGQMKTKCCKALEKVGKVAHSISSV